MFYRLGKFVTRYRWWIVGVWMVLGGIALPFAPQANQVLQSGGFVSPDAESQKAIDLLVQKIHLNPTIVQIIVSSPRYTADQPEFAQEAERTISRLRTGRKSRRLSHS